MVEVSCLRKLQTHTFSQLQQHLSMQKKQLKSIHLVFQVEVSSDKDEGAVGPFIGATFHHWIIIQRACVSGDRQDIDWVRKWLECVDRAAGAELH